MSDFEFFVFYFSSLKREWYLMGIIILICYIFPIRDFQSMIYTGFFSFSCFLSALARELLFQIYQSVVRIYLREKRDVFLYPYVSLPLIHTRSAHTRTHATTHTYTHVRARNHYTVCVCVRVCSFYGGIHNYIA